MGCRKRGTSNRRQRAQNAEGKGDLRHAWEELGGVLMTSVNASNPEPRPLTEEAALKLWRWRRTMNAQGMRNLPLDVARKTGRRKRETRAGGLQRKLGAERRLP